MIASTDSPLSSTTSPSPAAGPSHLASLESACIEIRSYLDRIRRSVDLEIRSYPTPIPRCDAQFNYLYEQRSRLAQAFDQAAAIVDGAATPDSLLNWATHLVKS